MSRRLKKVKMFCIFRQLSTRKSPHLVINFPRNLQCSNSNVNLIPLTFNLQLPRYKSKGGKNKNYSQVSETESEKESDKQGLDFFEDKYTKILKISTPSLRLDTIIKSGLGVARNKIELMFYENKVRVNGQKIPKKSITCKEGDEIDVIKGFSPTNPEFLTVARIEIVSVTAGEENINLKVKRSKALTIENYSGINCYK